LDSLLSYLYTRYLRCDRWR